MGRIRTIKPEFPQSEAIGSLSREARLLFIQLWTLCDDSGRTRGNSRMLASLLYPYDNDAKELIEDWIDQLLGPGLIRRYEVDGDSYIDIPNWLKHQKIDKPTPSKHPPFAESSASPRESSCEDQGSRIKDQGSPTAHSAPTHTPKKAAEKSEPEWFVEFKAAYPRRSGDQGWRKALRAARERVREGHTSAEFVSGAKLYAAFCKATDKIGTEFVKQAATFLGPDKPFLQAWEIPSKYPRAPFPAPTDLMKVIPAPIQVRDHPLFKGIKKE